MTGDNKQPDGLGPNEPTPPDEAQRPTEEAGYIASGLFDIEIAGVWHRLGEGDSFRFAGKPYRWRNPGAEPAVVIWVVSSPVY